MTLSAPLPGASRSGSLPAAGSKPGRGDQAGRRRGKETDRSRAARHGGHPRPGPHKLPQATEESPALLFHAASKAMRHYLYEGFTWFVAAYRAVAEKLQEGDPGPHFPRGSFPPPLPFVGG